MDDLELLGRIVRLERTLDNLVLPEVAPGALGPFAAVTINAGVITKPASAFCLSVDTEGGAASDNLDTINGGAEGDWIILKAEDSARTVSVQSGAGNIALSASPFALDNVLDKLTLVYDGSTWCEVAQANNGA